MRHFFILGNGHSGSSLFRGLMNMHSQIDCEFENFTDNNVTEQITKWKNKRDDCKIIYGNKVPLEQFLGRGWTDEDIIKIADEGFYILWLQRRFSRYNEVTNNEIQTQEYKKNWDAGRTLYWKLKEKFPTQVLEISFEDLLSQTEIELIRVCYFLGINYEEKMLQGCNYTGFKKYNQGTINKERI